MESGETTKAQGTVEEVDVQQTKQVDDASATDVPKKKIRKREKQRCNLIRQQMEFYFSDANLRRDRFLKKQIDQSSDGTVELSVFANFNKIKNITTDMALVAKALSRSEILKVSEDKKRVHRTSPISQANDVDDRTVYVECLPATADHEYLRKVFSSCGSVLYVSLPRYRTSGDIKGFAFIEFETKQGAQKAHELLNNPPASAGSKAGKFPKHSKQLDSINKKVGTQKLGSTEDSEADMARTKKRKRSRSGSDSAGEEKIEDRPMRKGRKRRASQSESGEESGSVPSKRKLSLQDESKDSAPPREEKPEKRTKDKKKKRKPSGDDTADAPTSSVKKPKQEGVEQENSSAPTEQSKADNVKSEDVVVPAPIKQESIMKKDTDGGEDSRGGKRKRRSEGGEGADVKKVRISEKVEIKVTEEEGKKRRKKKKKKQKELKLDMDLPELRVMPKSEWLELKKKYLTLQKASMSQLKQALTRNTLTQQATRLVAGEDQMQLENLEGKKPAGGKTLEFVPDVILKVSSGKEICRKQLKEAVQPHGEVAYVDVPEGQSAGFVRCHNAENAAQIGAATVEGYTFEKLEGEEEKAYWEKITADREKKLNTKTKSKRRGRDKVMRQAERTNNNINKKKHVFF